MNAYEYILKQIEDGVDGFVVAMICIYLYIISSGTLTQNDMTTENVNYVMTKLTYTYNAETNILNDGTSDYTTFQLLSNVITNYYATSEPLHNGTMLLMIINLKNKNKITETEATTLKGML